MSELAEKTCEACARGAEPLQGEQLKDLAAKLPEGWAVVDDHHLKKLYQFKDFREALEFTKRVGELAEDEGHHPDIYLGYGRVELQVWTHKIDGLTESDFIFAAKADAVC